MGYSGSRAARALLPQLVRLMRRGSLTGFSEAELLEEFLVHQDEAAFEAIVARHGPMVLNVCRQLLRDPNDVDDAFQATFIVLVRRAASLKRRDLLGNWLHGVAYRVASRIRSTTARMEARVSSNTPIEAVISPGTASAGLDPDVLLHLHEAVDRLPECYRIPIVLCYFEGLTHEEAAERLGWPLGSVKGRLSRARDLLRSQLVRRGIGPSAGTILAGIEQQAHAVIVPHLLRVQAVRSALAISGKSAQAFTASSAISLTVATLAQGVVRTMVFSQIRAAAIPILVGMGIAASGASVIAFQDSKASRPKDGANATTSDAPSDPGRPPVSKQVQKEKQRPATRKGEVLSDRSDVNIKHPTDPSQTKMDPKTKVILEKLDEPISMNFEKEVPIQDILKYIQSATSAPDYSGIPIYVDPIGLQEAEKTLMSPISLKLEGVPLKTTLRLILKQLGLAYHVHAGFLMISTPRGIAEALRKAEIERAEQELANAIVQAENDPKTKQILKKLDLPIAMDFVNETPLQDVLRYIQSATADPRYSGIPIYVDPIGLRQAEQTPRSKITIKLEGLPLGTTLKAILKQLGLDYCVHGGFLMISSPKGIREELEHARVELGIPDRRLEHALKNEAEVGK